MTLVMPSKRLTGYASLLKKQREAKLKRLSGLTLKNYFQSMETYRQTKQLNPEIKKYLLYTP